MDRLQLLCKKMVLASLAIQRGHNVSSLEKDGQAKVIFILKYRTATLRSK